AAVAAAVAADQPILQVAPGEQQNAPRHEDEPAAAQHELDRHDGQRAQQKGLHRGAREPAERPAHHRAVLRAASELSGMASRSEEETHGTCSPSVAREMPMRAWLNTSSTLLAGLRASLSSSVMNRLFFPVPSLIT